MALRELLQKRVLEIVVAEFIVFTLLGYRLHTVFAQAKTLIPFLAFLMLLQPMYSIELGASLLNRLQAKKRAILLAAALYTVAYPLLTLLAAQLWAASLPAALHRLLAGVVLVALSPVAMPAPAFTALAGGDVEVSVATVVTTFILAPAVIPAYSALILHRVVSLPLSALVRSILLYIAAPLAVAQMLRLPARRLGGSERVYAERRIAASLAMVSCLALYAIVAIAFANAAPVVVAHASAAAILLASLLAYNAARYAIAGLAAKAARLARGELIALLFAASQNGALGMALAAGAAGMDALAGAVLAGPVAVLLSMSAVAKLLQRGGAQSS